jgi:hypothetical protein
MWQTCGGAGWQTGREAARAARQRQTRGDAVDVSAWWRGGGVVRWGVKTVW